MKRRNLFHWLCFFIIGITIWTGCSKDELNDSKPASVSTLKSGNSQGIIMQAFYWNVTSGGVWWSTVQGKVSAWAGDGITAIWLPPCCKCQSGALSCGYDPFDYFDFGDYTQMGTTKTLYGNKSSLTSLISAAHTAGLKVYADIVINHNGGGSAEANANTGGTTYTKFSPASGIFSRSYNDFHPSTYETSDEGTFSTYPDLCHLTPNVYNNLYVNSNSVAKYYKNTLGYDGWRFDYVAGFHASVVKAWISAASGFSVGEYWDSSVSNVQSWITSEGSTSSAFDFPLLYVLQSAFVTSKNLALLGSSSFLAKSNPTKAVTFVTNHDENYITTNKLLAYAFIMTHEGTPCIFYTDFESELSKDKLINLIWINKNLAAGTTTVLYTSTTSYIAKMSGSPGLVVFINTSSSSASQTVTTNWASKTIKDYTGNVSTTATTSSSGSVTITAPADSYSVWSTQ